MTARYEAAVEKVTAAKNSEYLDFMARRLVEMAGNIIMSYLMLLDATRNAEFEKSARVYFNMAKAEVAKHADFIDSFNPADVELYKQA